MKLIWIVIDDFINWDSDFWAFTTELAAQEFAKKGGAGYLIRCVELDNPN